MAPDATMLLLKDIARVLSYFIGGIDVLMLLVINAERFFGARGRLVGFLSYFLPPVANTLKISMRKLALWNESGEKEEKNKLIQEYGVRDDLEGKHPFSQWMIAEMVKKYENNAQGIAYLGAAMLILVIGLRGIQVLGKADAVFIVLALILEFTLIGMLGLLLFYKPEEGKGMGMSLALVNELRDVQQALTEEKSKLAKFQSQVEESLTGLRSEVDKLGRAEQESRKK